MIKKLSFRNKRTLITGNRGFIGSNLTIKGIGWDKKDKRDIFDFEFEEAVKKTDIVIHLAALLSENHKKEMFKVNVLGTARVVELCMKYKKKLIFASSAAVYQPQSSDYAWTKYLAEELVWGARKKIPVVILRFFNVFGEGMSKRTNPMIYRFITEPQIRVYSDGEQTRDFIHVRDVCAIIQDAIKNKWNGVRCDVGTGEWHTIEYIANLIGYFRKRKVVYLTPREEIKWSRADTRILNKLYRENLTTNLEKDLKELCQ